jgi:pimeloyl-ACP methyl ester carboxylesterase
MYPTNTQRVRLSSGVHVAVDSAGDPAAPSILLLHGFPSSARTFRDVIPVLSQSAHVIAPDLPGFGRSEVLPDVSFAGLIASIYELLERLSVGRRYIYLHDFGAPVGLGLAMGAPELISGLVIQNANAHRSGMGAGWSDTFAYWADPNAATEAAATAHLTYEGTRDQYVAGVPAEVAAGIDADVWAEDWRVMNLPGRMQAQRALIADYANHAARFGEIAEFLASEQPPALMLWGRHDAFFDIAETLSWMTALPRMEAHVFDGGHFLLETHAAPAAALISQFMARTEARRRG